MKNILNGDQRVTQVDLPGLVTNLKKQTSIRESLAILINLTRSSDDICVTLIRELEIIPIIEKLIKEDLDTKTCIELLINLSNVPQFQINRQLLNLLLKCNGYYSELIKVFSNISLNLVVIDQTNVIYKQDYNYTHNLIIGQLKEMFIQNDQQVVLKVLMTYNRYIEIFQHRHFIKEDLRAIKYLLTLNQANLLIQPICSIMRNLWFKENEDFLTNMIPNTNQFIQLIIQNSSQLSDIVVVLELCASIFSQQTCILFFTNTDLLFKIVALTDNLYDIDIRKTAILALRILAETFDELVIQMMAAENVFETLLDQLRDDQFNNHDQISILTILNIIGSYFSVQNYDYPTYLEKLALSDNKEIADLSNQILKQFTDIGIIQ